ncbi:dihydrodipicolinate synthase family protein [Alistipes finegoldii]|uniref:dihydrodipicolinate synthase family protein n=1 Tax=Alistipes finegoldii TaxID=214856 RepID=UPI0024313603|nr:dihydrodipicolinate synthase family protein [Alistipes finegoldii]
MDQSRSRPHPHHRPRGRHLSGRLHRTGPPCRRTGGGVDAVGTVAPFYLKPGSVEELVAFYKPIAAACAPLPFYAYHIPSMTGINLPMIDFLKNGSKEIPNLNGIKFTSNNFMEMIECIRFDGGRFDILNGFDEMLLCGMAVGARGGVGSTYNYSLRTSPA